MRLQPKLDLYSLSLAQAISQTGPPSHLRSHNLPEKFGIRVTCITGQDEVVLTTQFSRAYGDKVFKGRSTDPHRRT